MTIAGILCGRPQPTLSTRTFESKPSEQFCRCEAGAGVCDLIRLCQELQRAILTSSVLQGMPTAVSALLNLGELMFQSHASYRHVFDATRHSVTSIRSCLQSGINAAVEPSHVL